MATSYMTSLPGAPDGEYVVVQFETSFTNKKAAAETVTPMLENDGQWRVSGYYIKEQRLCVLRKTAPTPNTAKEQS